MYHYQKRSGDEPAETKVHGGHSSGHLFDVAAESANPVEPRYRDNFEKCQKHYGYRGGVVVDQLEEEYTALKKAKNKLLDI